VFPQPQTGAGFGFGGSAPGGAAGGAQREVKYKVTVTADVQQAQQAFSNLAGAAHQAAGAAGQGAAGGMQWTHMGGNRYGWGMPSGNGGAWVSQGNNQWQHFGGPASGGAGGGGGAAQAGGEAANLAASLSRLVAVVAVVTAGFKMLENTFRSVADAGLSSMSARTKYSNAIGRVPFVGGYINDMVGGVMDAAEMFSNTGGGYGSLGAYNEARDRVAFAPYTNAQEGIRRGYQNTMADRAVGDQYDDWGRRRLFAQNTAGIRLMHAPSDYFGPPAPGRTRFDKNDEFDAILRGAAISEAQASAGMDALGSMRNIARTNFAAVDRAALGGAVAADQAFGAAQSTFGLSQSDPTVRLRLADDVHKAERAIAEQIEQTTRAQEKLNEYKKRGVEYIQAEYELGQKQLGNARAQLEVTSARIKQLKGYEVEYSNMDPATRESLAGTVERANRKGFKELTYEERQLLLGTGVTREFAEKRAQADVEKDPAFAELLRVLGMDDRATLEKRKIELQGKIELGVELNESTFRRQMEEFLDKISPLEDTLIKRVVDARLREVEVKRFQSTVSRSE
jgi:hypothetical protein